MPSNYEAIAEEIRKKIQTANNCGRVQLFVRQITELSRLKELLFDSGQGKICGWVITREGFKDEQLTGYENLRVSTFLLRGYYSFEDDKESELNFQHWIDDVSAAFRPQDSLNETCETFYPIQARYIGHVQIADTLLHYCELTLDVQELISS